MEKTLLINYALSFVSHASTHWRSKYVTAETNNSLSHSQTNTHSVCGVQGHCSKASLLSMRPLWLLDTHQMDLGQFALKFGPSH